MKHLPARTAQAAELFALLATCKQIYREATPVWFETNRFAVNRWGALGRMQHRVRPRRGLKLITWLELVYNEFSAFHSQRIAKVQDMDGLQTLILHANDEHWLEDGGDQSGDLRLRTFRHGRYARLPAFKRL